MGFNAAPGGGRPRWVAQSERGVSFTMRLIAWIALRLGRTTARILLYPICLYFLLFSIDARAGSRVYLRRVLQREVRLADSFRNYHTFAATILDRVFFVAADHSAFDIRVYGHELVREATSRGEGCLLIGAHLGSFEVMRTLARHTDGARVSMVMYEENARKINGVLSAISPEAVLDVIALGKVDSMLRVEHALASGEFVAMLADRSIAGEGTVTCQFLGAPVRIPVGPFRIAAMLKRRIVLMFGLYRDGNRYDIHFEELADMRHLERGERSAAIDGAIAKYVARLEHYCRVAPYNWFNFYDYWA